MRLNFKKKGIVMGARRAGEQNVRSISQNKTGTYQMSLPIELVRELKWKNHQRVVVKKQGNKLVVEDWKE